MSIKAIETQDSTRSPFGFIAKTSIAGGILGYVAKDLIPLSESEMDEEFKGAMAIIREQSHKAKASAIEHIRNIPDKTLAQDTFIKMVDSDKNVANRAFNMRKIALDAKLSETDMTELRGLMSSVNKKAQDMYKLCSKRFVSAMKDKRVLPAYIATGAVLGFFAGLGQSVFRASSEV